MGILLSSLWSMLWPQRPSKVLIVGLDNAGKTTVLYKLSLGEVVVTVPTVGANHETYTHGNTRFELWDLGGQSALRTNWPVYYRGTDAVIVVVDSTDRQRMGTVAAEVSRLLASEELHRAAILVLANKQDLQEALSPEELSAALGLTSVRSHAYHVQASCALTGEGLMDAMAWLAAAVTHTADAAEAPGGG